MWTDAILAYLHFGAIFTLIWFLAKEWTLLRVGADKVDLERLALADAGFGMAAGVVVATGALRAIFGVKGWSFYEHNHVFWLKMALFAIVGLLSIAPTKTFLRWRRTWPFVVAHVLLDVGAGVGYLLFRHHLPGLA